MLFILNKKLDVVEILSNKGDYSKITPYFDDLYKQDLHSGAETFNFSTFADSKKAQHLTIGNYICFKDDDGEYKLFNIINIEETHDDYFIKEVYCEMAGIELINSIVRPMKINSANLRKYASSILEGTDWQVGIVDMSFTELMDFETTELKTVYELIQENIIGLFNAEIRYRVEMKRNTVTGKYIDFFRERGSSNGYRFSYSSNVECISRSMDSSEIVTAMIGEGKNGLTFKEVDTPDKPLNQDFIANESAYKLWNKSGKHIFGKFKYDTESPQELLKLTREELIKKCVPKAKYEVKANVLEGKVRIGDTVFVVDHEFNPPLYLSARISCIMKSRTDSDKDEVILANYKEVKSNITNEMRQIASQLEGYVDGKFPIGGDDIQNGAIDGDKLQNGQIITGTHLFANSVTADKIMAGEIKTEHLSADSIKAEHISANQIEAEHIKAGTIIGDNIHGGTITGDHIIGGTINGGHIQAGSIIAGSGIIAEGAIGNAQISNLEADKLSAGTIDTSKITIAGPNGNLKLRGNRVQVFEGHGNQQYERVSLGDVDNDGTKYGLRVRGKDGTTILYDENGVYEEGITDGAITNDKISGEANIDGYKLNINSVIREVNGATETISGTKISVDGTNLEVKLSQQDSTITEHGTELESQSGRITANESAIKLKVDSQIYESDKEGLEHSIQKNTNAIEVLDSGIDMRVEESISKVGIGANNYIKNSGEFESKEFWSGDFVVEGGEIKNNGEQLVNTTTITINEDEDYVFSATVKLPHDFVMNERNLLDYILLGG